MIVVFTDDNHSDKTEMLSIFTTCSTVSSAAQSASDEDVLRLVMERTHFDYDLLPLKYESALGPTNCGGCGGCGGCGNSIKPAANE